MANLKGNSRNANYDFAKEKDPKRRMGQEDFANLPNRPMYMGFSGKHDYRDGIINGFTCEVSEISDMSENEK